MLSFWFGLPNLLGPILRLPWSMRLTLGLATSWPWAPNLLFLRGLPLRQPPSNYGGPCHGSGGSSLPARILEPVLQEGVVVRPTVGWESLEN